MIASRRKRGEVGLALAALLVLGAASNDPAERLPDPRQETQARNLFKEVRCLVCQNESIDDSEADLAADLRRIVREQVHAGRSDAEIRRFLADRYGAFVLLKPPFEPGTAVLWLTPLVIVLAGAGVMLSRRRRGALEPPLTAVEQAQLKALERRP